MEWLITVYNDATAGTIRCRPPTLAV